MAPASTPVAWPMAPVSMVSRLDQLSILPSVGSRRNWPGGARARRHDRLVRESPTASGGVELQQGTEGWRPIQALRALVPHSCEVLASSGLCAH